MILNGKTIDTRRKNMLIGSNNYKIIESNSTFLFGKNDELTILLDGLTIVFDFVDVPGDQVEISAEAKEAKLSIRCENFNSKSGIGSKMPLEVGTKDNGNVIFIHFWTWLLGDGIVRKLEYTLFEGSETCQEKKNPK